VQLAPLGLAESCPVPNAKGYLNAGSAGWLFPLANVQPLDIDIVICCSALRNCGHVSSNVGLRLAASPTLNLTGISSVLVSTLHIENDAEASHHDVNIEQRRPIIDGVEIEI
jgi:hypothetical protein